MRVLNISESDYANYGHNIAKSLRKVDVDCVDVCTDRHGFKYKECSPKISISDLIELVKKSDVINVMHSHESLFELAKRHNSKAKIIVWHTGTRYRQNPAKLNRMFAKHTTVTDQSEFIKLGQHKYVVSPVEIGKPKFQCSTPVKIAHYPSNVEVKGTDNIIGMLQKFKGKFQWLHDTRLLPHFHQIDRMSKCDVYIELFKPILWGKEYGCFGVTALEAAAMGKLVITQDLNAEVYIENYGEHPFFIANSPEIFSTFIDNILNAGPEQIIKFQKKAHKLMGENHSFSATGQRVLEIINNAW